MSAAIFNHASNQPKQRRNIMLPAGWEAAKGSNLSCGVFSQRQSLASSLKEAAYGSGDRGKDEEHSDGGEARRKKLGRWSKSRACGFAKGQRWSVRHQISMKMHQTWTVYLNDYH
jgi:hypothetical protein